MSSRDTNPRQRDPTDDDHAYEDYVYSSGRQPLPEPDDEPDEPSFLPNIVRQFTNYAVGNDPAPSSQNPLLSQTDAHHQRDSIDTQSTHSLIGHGGNGRAGRQGRKGWFFQKQNESQMNVPLRNLSPVSAIERKQTTNNSQPPEPARKPRFRIPFFGRKNQGAGTNRYIFFNQPLRNNEQGFISNHISTAKYNIFTFLPKFLKEQFSKWANVFFLLTAILQQIPNISPTNRYTTIAPLTVVLLVSAIKEQVEDIRRKRSDRTLNNSKTRVLRDGAFVDAKWVNIKVGDIVRVESEEPFPADLVLLSSSNEDGMCYIETANLDGETNLKIKDALPETALALQNIADLTALSGHIKSEHPNSSLYTYEGTITIKKNGTENEYSLNPLQVLLRGATLRNTEWIHGVVVFTGHESKLMRNATAAPIKKTAIAKMLNIQILILGGILISLSIISSIGDIIVRQKNTEQLSYVGYGSYNIAKQFFSDILTYWVLYSNLVPISLFVTLEMVQYVIALLIDNDLDMYHEETDTPANCRTSSLVEELGQIEYIFSDKTGTLTCNEMVFKQCSIAGIQYGDDVPDNKKGSQDNPDGVWSFDTVWQSRQTSESSDYINHFLSALSICHTVIPEVKEGKIKYQAASPDEGALVDGAIKLGYRFIDRDSESVTVEILSRIISEDITKIEVSEVLKPHLLDTCEFNSTRKRMSSIYRIGDKIILYCKGADTVIQERLCQTTDPEVLKLTLKHLEEYAKEGLRTLCLAYREIPLEEYQDWKEKFDEANRSVSGNRADEVDLVIEEIETDLILLGATAIEDRLQDGVPDTIKTLQEAGIKIWVLTGDRQETAFNIGVSCKLINEDEMQVLTINEEDKEATTKAMNTHIAAIKETVEMTKDAHKMYALLIDGRSLQFALEADSQALFFQLGNLCRAVICCRVSPLQKAQVVGVVKNNSKSVLLAIGDGANDVSMIQAAHIGVGISGNEGLQAARSADVSIAQFRYLRKLILIHGAWSYHRVTRVILYSFYKNVALFMTQFWYSFQNAFSGEIIYESWTLSCYNVFFTFFPPFVLGIFDQFLNARKLDRHPDIYEDVCLKNKFFRMHSFFSWVLNGFYHSLILYYVSQALWLWDAPEADGRTAGHWVWGTGLYTAALATVLGKAAMITSIWTKWTILFIPGSFLLWVIFLPIFATVAPKVNNFAPEYHGVLRMLLKSPRFWLQFALLPVLCLLRDYVWKYYKRMYRKERYHKAQEEQKYNILDYSPRMEQFQKALRKVRELHRSGTRRGYAYSKGDNDNELRLAGRRTETFNRGRVQKMGRGVPVARG